MTQFTVRAGRKGTGGDRGLGRRPGSAAAKAPAGRATLPRPAGFWLVAGVLFLLLFASAAASPLYSVYQAQWRFSATTLTAVFAVYVLAQTPSTPTSRWPTSWPGWPRTSMPTTPR